MKNRHSCPLHIHLAIFQITKLVLTFIIWTVDLFIIKKMALPSLINKYENVKYVW